MKKSSIIIVAIFIGVLAWLFLNPIIAVPNGTIVRQDLTTHPISAVQIAGQTIKVEIADTDAKRELGLSGHAPLSDTQGMLFVFDTPGIYSFWMKDMLFPLDIIWLAPSEVEGTDAAKVIYIAKDLQPSSYPSAFRPTRKCKLCFRSECRLFRKE